MRRWISTGRAPIAIRTPNSRVRRATEYCSTPNSPAAVSRIPNIPSPEAIVMTVAFTYFVAHTAMSRADKSFLDYRLLKNAHYVTGSVFIFIVGMVLFGSRALTPTMLENLLGYPVATTGLVIAPSGLGTMATMMIAGRIMGRVDLRVILFAGLVLTALPLWQMTHYSLDLSQSDIVWPSLLQGMGIGLVFVPLSAATFATSYTPGSISIAPVCKISATNHFLN